MVDSSFTEYVDNLPDIVDILPDIVDILPEKFQSFKVSPPFFSQIVLRLISLLYFCIEVSADRRDTTLTSVRVEPQRRCRYVNLMEI